MDADWQNRHAGRRMTAAHHVLLQSLRLKVTLFSVK